LAQAHACPEIFWQIGRNILMAGPPGSGKSMLAVRLPRRRPATVTSDVRMSPRPIGEWG